MSSPEVTLTSRVWSFSVGTAPPVTGMTSGLNEAACFPQRMTIHEYASDRVEATLEGPRARKDGTKADAWVTVKVTISVLDGSFEVRYPRAPEWILAVYRNTCT